MRASGKQLVLSRSFWGDRFLVSKVKEAHRFRHDFGKITKFGTCERNDLQGIRKKSAPLKILVFRP